MNILAGAGAVSGLLQGTASVVQSLRQPKLTDETFSEIFKAQLASASGPDAREAKARDLSSNFVSLRDVDGDGSLRFDESGLTDVQFKALDADSNGRVSVDEVKANLMNEGT